MPGDADVPPPSDAAMDAVSDGAGDGDTDGGVDPEVCGDNEPDPGEACDDGDTEGGDGCSADCTVEPLAVCPAAGPCAYCGDGSLRTGHATVADEQCDDGNAEDGDGCSAACTKEGEYACPIPGQPCELCGNGRDEPNEQCDDGGYCVDGVGGVGARCDADADCGSGETCEPRGGDGCNATCTGVEEHFTCGGPDDSLDVCTRCGDGVVDAEAGEICDDGGRCTGDDATACDADADCAGVGGTCEPRNSDGCSLCQQIDFGYVCPEAGGACARCGDGVLEPGIEACDDGNAFAGDGCAPFSNDGDATNDCRIEAGFHCVHETGTATSPDTRSCARCGDGVRQPGEACDDGNQQAGDGCGYVTDAELTNDCYVETGYVCEGALTQTSACYDCGNGIVEGTEVCDNDLGGTCSGAPAQGCTTDADCTGLGVCQGVAGDGCAASCKAIEPTYRCADVGGTNACFRCGDGHLDVEVGEVCDDGDNAGGDGCNASCFEESGWSCVEAPDGTFIGCSRCGDGIVQTPIEGCDDRNAVAGDGCDACQVEAPEWTCVYGGGTFVHLGCADCGDGVVRAGIETCDDANEVAGDGCGATCALEDPSQTDWTCTYSSALGRTVCNRCGDGVVQGPTEVCDDGDESGGDGCSATCKRLEVGFTCAEGPLNGGGAHDPSFPTTVCHRCGDGVIDPGQTCDDGDAFGGDGCSATCQLEPGYYGCYDVIADPGLIPETCLRCGDGRVSNVSASGPFPAVAELCDDGNTMAGDGCTAACQTEGGGYNCFVPGQPCVRCGNAIVEVGETCDDGDFLPGDGCSASCQIEPLWQCQIFSPGNPSICALCGDGSRSGLESCDDGNREGGDGCSGSCAIEPGYVCSGASCAASLCGDGIRAGAEACDDGNTLSGDCCNTNCRLERDDTVWSPVPTSGHPYGTCVATVCGDGVVQGLETCDTGGNPDAACVECRVVPGYTCTAAGCSNASCGNGVVTGGEQCECDGMGCFYTAAGARTPLPAAATCTGCVVVDAPGGAARCGNGVVDTAISGMTYSIEACDDGNVVGGDGCSATCALEPFYVCASQPGAGGAGSCRIGLQFVEVAQYPGVTEVDPTAFFYDPLTRSFVGFKRQGSGDVPMELCLDGTLQEADPDHFRPTLSGSSTTLEGAVYDPRTDNVFFLFDASGFKVGRVSAGLLRTPSVTRNLAGVVSLLGPGGATLSDANDAGDMTIGEDGRLYVTYLNGSNQITYDYTIGGGTTSPSGAGFVVYPPRAEGVVDFTTTASDFIPLPVTVNNSTEPLGAAWFVPGWDVVATFTNPAYPSPFDPYGSRQVFTFLGYSDTASLVKHCLSTTTGLPTNPSAPVTCTTNATCGGTTSTICGFRFDDDYYAQSYLLNNPTNGFTPQGPGPLFRSVTSGHDLADTAGAAATATDGSGFVICTTNSNSERCRLFSLACTPGPVGDDTCAQNSPGTTCTAGGYCTRAAGANDDYAQFEANAGATPIDVLANDVVGPAACYNRAKQVVAIGDACFMGHCTPGNVADQPDAPGTVAIAPGGTGIVYTPSPSRECGYVDTFLYWARLGNVSSTTPLYDYATVTVVVGCDCGDGVVQSNEQCDPASPTNVYACDPSTCRIIPTCGNALVEPGEACDDGDVTNGDGCDATCELEYVCGDGLTDPAFETCDDGGRVSGDGCSSTCQIEECGDGVVQVGLGEACDNGPDVPSDGCDAECQAEPLCGNDVVEAGEECDEGAANGDDGACLASCRLAWCGDSYVHTGVEECDFGAPGAAETCTFVCTVNTCGDGILFGAEACDPGEAGTSSACRDAGAGPRACSLAACGDGTLDATSDRDGDPYSADTFAEVCDDGNTADGDGCRADCSRPTCGDGRVDADSYVSPTTTFVEECDDGNTNDADGCLTSCRIPYCGDGVVSLGEECDTALPPGPLGCDAACRVPNYCGDGELGGAESCDQGAANGTPTSPCSGTCALAYCGDGRVDAASDPDRNPFTTGGIFAETCDDGGTTSGDGCSNVCVDEWVCGDGNVDPGEQCDDGNTSGGDGCSGCSGTACRDTQAPGFTGCRREEICGDGVLQAASEQCDDGNAMSGDGCSATCTREVCGDGTRQAGLGEECDQGASNGAPGATCTTTCRAVVCGNHRVESPYEDCDDGNVSSFDGCSSTCQIEID